MHELFFFFSASFGFQSMLIESKEKNKPKPRRMYWMKWLIITKNLHWFSAKKTKNKIMMV